MQKVEVMNFIKEDALQEGADVCCAELKDLNAFEDFLEVHAPLINEAYYRTVSFTGSRPAYLPWRYNEDCEICIKFKEKLKLLIELAEKKGYRHFITGMAMGFDLIVAEIIIELRDVEKLPITLECAIPCLNQSERWAISYKKRYDKIINSADRVTYVSNMRFYNGCYQKRNCYMVDSSNLLIAYCNEESKGSLGTIEYAKKKQKNIIIIDE